MLRILATFIWKFFETQGYINMEGKLYMMDL